MAIQDLDFVKMMEVVVDGQDNYYDSGFVDDNNRNQCFFDGLAIDVEVDAFPSCTSQ